MGFPKLNLTQPKKEHTRPILKNFDPHQKIILTNVPTKTCNPRYPLRRKEGCVPWAYILQAILLRLVVSRRI